MVDAAAAALVVEVRLTAEVEAPTATVPVTVARPSAMQSLTNEL